MARRFSQRQHIALYLAADGRCEMCGAELQPGWHGDHITPYSAGGATDVINGQALCPTCNLKKGTSMPKSPRQWQQRFISKYHANPHPDFLCVACPGAGKSHASALVAADLLRDGVIDRILVVVPSGPLRMQWHDTFTDLGIYLDGDTMNNTHGERSTIDGQLVQGWIVTYHSMANESALHRRLNAKHRTLAILDEVHHLSDEGSWGQAAQHALAPCVRRLSLSGTPFRSDATKMPFAEYKDGWARYRDDEEGPYPRGFDYSYGTALASKPAPVRPAVFETYDGDVSWLDSRDLTERKVRVSAESLDRKTRSKANRMVLDAGGRWLLDTVRSADQRLDMVREEGDTDAKGLVVCLDTEHAHAVARAMKQVAGRNQVLVAASKDADGEDASEQARKVIEDFGKGNARWLVAVAMVSEGVDIPQLRVGVYATTKRTDLFFRQVLGRLVRMRKLPEEVDQTAYMFIPKEPAVMALADAVTREVGDAVMQDDEDDDEPGERNRNSEGIQGTLNFDSFLDSTSEAGGFLVPGQGSFEHGLVDRLATESGRSTASVLDIMRAAQRLGLDLGIGQAAAPQQTGSPVDEPTPEPSYVVRIKSRKASLEKMLKQLAGYRLRQNGGEFGQVIRHLKVQVYRDAGIRDYARADTPQLEAALLIAKKMWADR